MRIPAKASNATATLVLLLTLLPCLIAVVRLTAVAYGRPWIVSEFNAPLTKTPSSVSGKIRALSQEGVRRRALENLWLIPEGSSLQKTTAPSDKSSLTNKRTPSATLQGLVIDTLTRQPIAGARVSLERGRVPVDVNGLGKGTRPSTLTDQRGRFQLEKIKPGEYKLMAAKLGYLSLSFDVVELEPGKTTTREILLDPLVKFSGLILDESNHPVREVRVSVIFDSLRPSIGRQRFLAEHRMSVLTTTTTRQGEFDLFVPADEENVTLVALAFGYAPCRLGPLSTQTRRARTGIILRLSRGLEAQGRIVDEDSTPIQGATIKAYSLGLGEVQLGLKDLEPRAMSGDDGRFILRGLEEGSYKLKVSYPNRASRTVPSFKVQSQTGNRLPDIVMLSEAEIRGRIADEDGQAIPDAKISGVSGEANNAEAISDDEGSFALNGFAHGASVTLSATAAGRSEASKVVRAPSTDVVLVLSRHSIIRGRVEDAETLSPVKDFSIRLAHWTEGRSFRSEDGTFELKGLRPGRWTFVARAPGYQAGEIAGLVIRAGEPTEGVIFSLVRGVELTGRVVDALTDAGLPNVTVSYRVASELEKASPWVSGLDGRRQTTDSDGVFKLDGLPRGKVMIIAQSPIHAEVRLTLVTGEQRFVEIKLPSGGFISGRVVGLDATTMMPGAQVSLWNVAKRSGSTIPADRAGGFSFSRLAAGRYQLAAETSLGQTKPQEIVLSENERLTGLILVVKAGATIRGKVIGLGADEHPLVEIVAQGQGGFEGSASTNPEGAYAIVGVPKGWVKVIAQTYSQRSVSKWIEVPEDGIELTLNIQFPREGRLSGRVTRANQPVAFRTVSAFPRDPQSATGSGRTDQNGMYAIDGLSEGDYVVSLSGETKSLRISGNTVLDIELPELSLSGRVLEEKTAQPLSGVTVQVHNVGPEVDAKAPKTAVTDSIGRFSVEGTEAGQYQVVAHKRGFKVGMEKLSIPTSSEFILSLAPAEGIMIRVRDGISGLSLRTVTVGAFSDAQPTHMDLALDDAGRGELPQLAPGRYNLLVSSVGYAPKSVMGWAVPGSALDLSLTPGGRLEILVDSVYASAKASLVDANGFPHQGEFTLTPLTVFPHLAPGEYTLLVKLLEQTKTYTANLAEGRTTVLQVK